MHLLTPTIVPRMGTTFKTPSLSAASIINSSTSLINSRLLFLMVCSIDVARLIFFPYIFNCINFSKPRSRFPRLYSYFLILQPHPHNIILIHTPPLFINKSESFHATSKSINSNKILSLVISGNVPPVKSRKMRLKGECSTNLGTPQ